MSCTRNPIGQTLLRFPGVSSPRVMAEALLCYASDAALRQKQGLAARRRVEAEFSIERMVARYAELYESLLRPQGAA